MTLLAFSGSWSALLLRVPVGCGKSRPDMSPAGRGRGAPDVFEEAGGLDGPGVASGSRGRPGDPQEPAGQIGPGPCGSRVPSPGCRWQGSAAALRVADTGPAHRREDPVIAMTSAHPDPGRPGPAVGAECWGAPDRRADSGGRSGRGPRRPDRCACGRPGVADDPRGEPDVRCGNRRPREASTPVPRTGTPTPGPPARLRPPPSSGKSRTGLLHVPSASGRLMRSTRTRFCSMPAMPRSADRPNGRLAPPDGVIAVRPSDPSPCPPRAARRGRPGGRRAR